MNFRKIALAHGWGGGGGNGALKQFVQSAVQGCFSLPGERLKDPIEVGLQGERESHMGNLVY